MCRKCVAAVRELSIELDLWTSTGWASEFELLSMFDSAGVEPVSVNVAHWSRNRVHRFLFLTRLVCGVHFSCLAKTIVGTLH